MSNLKLLLSTALSLSVIAATPSFAVKQDERSKIQESNETVGEYLDDAKITAEIKTALFAKPHLKALQIHVTTVQNIVTLDGVVNNQGQKNQAENVARGVQGVRDVINKLEIRDQAREIAEEKQTLGEKADDAAVTAKVKAKFKLEPNFDSSDMTVTTINNSVELKGSARSETDKTRAEQLAASVTGVKEVVNKLKVRR